MRHLMIILSVVLFCCNVSAQKKASPGKYNSLLWEISGKGMKKPAYLFGTMHVSSKLAFNLSDTFYNKIKSVDAVALETDPTTWQDDFQHSMYMHMSDISALQQSSLPDDYITKSSFQFSPYDKSLKATLANDPYIINSFLYRNFNGQADFEEATYLDMHIYQCGRKLFKPIYGLENFDESEKIMIKAYEAQARETKRKSHSKETEDENNSSNMSYSEKIEDAYRKGDLDLMDSLDRKEEQSEAFNELFLYKRNEIQAVHIDSLLKTGISIFAGVGAAHLPGARGVIELLRKEGYTLTPIIMGMQSPKQKEEINKVRIPVAFSKQVAEDSIFSVNVPGKLYSFSFASSLIGKQWIHADFGNGSYYTVSRLSTAAGLWGQDEAYVYRKIDSALYENIPGKILERTPIKLNGIKGFNIVNKTSKGNIQRYNIFVRGSEIIIFKMSGNEEYVQGPEADKFFSSIWLKPRSKNWKTFTPKNGAFNVSFPDDPIPGDANSDNDDSYGRKAFKEEPLSYECTDTATGNFYFVFTKSITNHEVLEEDTFNLALAAESFLTSEFINEPTYRKQINYKGFPCLETKGTSPEGSKYIARVFLKGNNYYTVLAKYNKAESEAQKFIQSFYPTPFKYEEAKVYTDSAMFFTVKSPVVPDTISKAFLDISRISQKTQELDRRKKDYEEPYWKETLRVLFRSNATNEIISVASRPYPKYYYINDSADFWKKAIENIKEYDTKTKTCDFIEKKRTFTTLPDRKICDVIVGDTGSSQIIKARWIIYNGRIFTLKILTDSALSSSNFIEQFYSSFTPLFDSSTNFDIYKPKSDVFFKDFYSKDSTVAKFAKKNISYIKFEEADIPNIIKAIKSLEQDNAQKDYLNYKAALIKEMGYLKKDSMVANEIKKLYDASIDTATLQNEAVLALARLKQDKSYRILKNILSTEPPVFDNSSDMDKLFDLMTDSAKLARSLLPDVLSLNGLDDYKKKITFLLTDLIDSNQIAAKDYESIFYKIFFDAKIEQKKLMATDEKLINKKEDDKTEHYKNPRTLKSYCKLLLPFWNLNPNVPIYFSKLLKTRDNTVKLNTVELLLKEKLPVHDSVLEDICKEEKYLGELFVVLKKDSVENRFPAKYKKQELLAKAVLVNSTGTYNKKDSIEYLNKYLPVSLKGQKGNVYFFKYKSSEKDVDWKLAVSGIQPENLKEINADETILEFTDKVLKVNQPLDTQLKKLLKEEVYSIRKSSSHYYGYSYRRNRYRY